MAAAVIDTHAHLDDERFRDDLDAVIDRAAAAGVAEIVTVATTAESSARTIAIARNHAIVVASVGIQPNHVAEARPSDWDAVVALASESKVAAIGETGLDRHWDDTPFDQQEDYFARHLDLARRTQLPVIIHCREAEADVARMLRADFDRHGPVRGVMHSYTGDKSTAEAAIQMGLVISFAGMLTYKSAKDLREVARTLPMDRLVVETDSPYLAPTPLRGKRNEPAHVVHTLAYLATLHGMDQTEAARRTTANARKLFAIPPGDD